MIIEAVNHKYINTLWTARALVTSYQVLVLAITQRMDHFTSTLVASLTWFFTVSQIGSLAHEALVGFLALTAFILLVSWLGRTHILT